MKWLIQVANNWNLPLFPRQHGLLFLPHSPHIAFIIHPFPTQVILIVHGHILPVLRFLFLLNLIHLLSIISVFLHPRNNTYQKPEHLRLTHNRYGGHTMMPTLLHLRTIIIPLFITLPYQISNPVLQDNLVLHSWLDSCLKISFNI